MSMKSKNPWPGAPPAPEAPGRPSACGEANRPKRMRLLAPWWRLRGQRSGNYARLQAAPPSGSNHRSGVSFAGLAEGQARPCRFALSWKTRAGRDAMVDRYTKAVLTVIAAALIGIVAQNAIGPLRAQSATRVVICDVNDLNRCASLWPY